MWVKRNILCTFLEKYLALARAHPGVGYCNTISPMKSALRVNLWNAHMAKILDKFSLFFFFFTSVDFFKLCASQIWIGPLGNQWKNNNNKKTFTCSQWIQNKANVTPFSLYKEYWVNYSCELKLNGGGLISQYSEYKVSFFLCRSPPAMAPTGPVTTKGQVTPSSSTTLPMTSYSRGHSLSMPDTGSLKKPSQVTDGWIFVCLVLYSRISTNGHLPTTATSLQGLCFPVPTSDLFTQILLLKTPP